MTLAAEFLSIQIGHKQTMKNRVILNGQGIPVVPKSDAIAAKVAESDIKQLLKNSALFSFEQGIETVCDCMTNAYQKAKEAGHESLSLDDGLKLVEELRRICKENLKKTNE